MDSILAGAVIGLHLLTAHTPTAQPMSGVNPGAYIRTAEGWTVGGYRNSWGRASVYGARTFETEGRRFALTVGAATGYDLTSGQSQCPAGAKHTPTMPCKRGAMNSPVSPLLVPSVRFNLGSVDARVSYMAKAEKGSAHALHLSMEWQLK